MTIARWLHTQYCCECSAVFQLLLNKLLEYDKVVLAWEAVLQIQTVLTRELEVSWT